MTPQHAARVQFEPGEVIGGRYRIVSLIGVGGLGRVYLARHIELETDVAMKVLRQEMAERPEAVQRFAREAQASVRLRSERVARVFDVGAHDGAHYFVMEYLRGCNLLELKQQEAVDVTTLCEFFIQACEGLAEAHAQGVVHRDIKPENLFVVRDANGWRSLKIFDFGISKFSLTGKHSDIDIAGKRTELMMGTPLYISPEQIRSTRDVDHRTDVWSLGVVMFEVLSGGILPFREEGEITALIAEVLEAPHRSLLDVAPDVPEGLAAIVDRCLVKDRDQRYQTAAEVAVDLLPFAPARARASAERAVAAMQVAGLMVLNADLGSARASHPPVSERLTRKTVGISSPPAPPLPAPPLPAVPAIPASESAPARRLVVPLIPALLVFAAGVAAAVFWFGARGEQVKASPAESVQPALGATSVASSGAPSAAAPSAAAESAVEPSSAQQALPPSSASSLPLAVSSALPEPAAAAPAARRRAPRLLVAAPTKAVASTKAPTPAPIQATKLELQRER